MKSSPRVLFVQPKADGQSPLVKTVRKRGQAIRRHAAAAEFLTQPRRRERPIIYTEYDNLGRTIAGFYLTGALVRVH